MATYTDDELSSLVDGLLRVHTSERIGLDRIKKYRDGTTGAPIIPEGASQEIKDIASLAVKNVLGMIVSSFTEALSVRAYHRSDSTENEPVWHVWTRNRMNARQAAVYRSALTYGVSYVTVLPGAKGPVLRTNSPRQMVALYADPAIDVFPTMALEIYSANVDGVSHRMGMLLDSENVWTIDFGVAKSNQIGWRAESISEPYRHGAVYDGEAVTPVVRFVNAWSDEDSIVGEVEPLVTDQCAINQTNFDRLLVARFGAFPHKVLTGVDLDDDDDIISSADSMTVIPDENAKVQSFPAAQLEPYNGLLKEQMAHVAMSAQMSPNHLTGDMVNLSADALANMDQAYQRKIKAKMDSFGDSWVVALQVAANYDGDDISAADDEALISWRPTETRTLGQVGDFISKVSLAGVPVDELLDLVPGLTQQKIVSIKQKMQGGSDMAALISGLTNLGSQEA